MKSNENEKFASDLYLETFLNEQDEYLKKLIDKYGIYKIGNLDDYSFNVYGEELKPTKYLKCPGRFRLIDLSEKVYICLFKSNSICESIDFGLNYENEKINISSVFSLFYMHFKKLLKDYKSKK